MFPTNGQHKNMMEQQQADSSYNMRLDSRNMSSRDQSISFLEQARLKLSTEYNDIDDNDFQMIDEKQEEYIQNTTKNNYMRYHSIFVPIGSNFQVQIPDLISNKTYVSKSKQSLKKIKALKMSDPQQTANFYNNNEYFLQSLLGQRIYEAEDVAMLKKCYQQFPQRCSFEEYLKRDKIVNFWREYFFTKQKNLANRGKKKKKKPKGSIPV